MLIANEFSTKRALKKNALSGKNIVQQDAEVIWVGDDVFQMGAEVREVM